MFMLLSYLVQSRYVPHTNNSPPQEDQQRPRGAGPTIRESLQLIFSDMKTAYDRGHFISDSHGGEFEHET
jgi:hypothetical protein